MNHISSVVLEGTVQDIRIRNDDKGKTNTSIWLKNMRTIKTKDKEWISTFNIWLSAFGKMDELCRTLQIKVGDEVKVTGSFETKSKEITTIENKKIKIYKTLINIDTIEILAKPAIPKPEEYQYDGW